MAKKTATITLGENTYEIPQLNIGQLEDIAIAATSGKARPFEILRVIMSRAIPACKDIKTIEASPAEIRAATDAIMALSDLEIPKGEAEPPAPAA